jgi:hypothetical protein
VHDHGERIDPRWAALSSLAESGDGQTDRRAERSARATPTAGRETGNDEE